MAQPLTPLGQQIDDAVAINRAATPALATTQRRVPRVSIAELNAMDREQLQDRLHEAIRNADNRGPVQTVLDMIDLPRNALFNLLAPGEGEKARAAGEKGTFGLGRVTTSDLLGKAGVEPGIIRGVLGFVGDVALDPLTYAGPPGWGAKVVTKAGSVALRKGAQKALTAELGAAARGATAAVTKSQSARRLVEAAVARRGVDGADQLAKLQAIAARGGPEAQAKLEGILARRAQGAATNSGVGKALARVGLNEIETSGGALSRFGESLEKANDLGRQQITAAEDFVKEFGKGTERGLAFGKDATSAVAHIPLTDIAVRVPAFTMEARNAAANLRLANDARNGLEAIKQVDPTIAAAATAARATHDSAESLPVIHQTARAAQDPVIKDIDSLSTELDAIRDTDPESLGTRNPINDTKDTFILPGEEWKNEGSGRGFAGLKAAVARIDPYAVVGEPGASRGLAPKIADKMDELIDGPKAGAGRGAYEFLADQRAAYDANPENGARAVLASAFKAKHEGVYKPYLHGPVQSLDAERLRPGDQWQYANDTFTVLERDPATGQLKVKWDRVHSDGSSQLGERIVTIGPTVNAQNGTPFKTMLPANEHSFIGSVPAGDTDALAKQSTLIARQAELKALRSQQDQAATLALDNATTNAKAIQSTIAKIKPDGSQLSARQLMTMGQLKSEADAATRVALAKKKIYDAGLGIRANLAEKFDDVNIGAETLSQTQRELFDLVNANPDEAEAMSKAYEQLYNAQADLSKALHSPVLHATTGQDRVLREVAKKALGTSDDIIGTAPFMSASRAAAQILGDQNSLVRQMEVVDRYMRRAFGSKSGSSIAQQKYWKNTLLSTHNAGEYAHRIQAGLADALKTAGYDVTPELMEQAKTLMTVEMERLRDPAGRVFSLKDWITGEWTPQAKLLMQAKNDGLYASERGRALRLAIRDQAKEELALLDATKDAELADDVLGVTMDNYLPLGMTPHGQQEVARVNSIIEGAASSGKPADKERFQMQRMTNQTRFVDPRTGERKRFFEGERAVLAENITDAQMDQWRNSQAVDDIPDFIKNLVRDGSGNIDEARATSLMRIADDIKTYDELPDELKAQFPMTATSPFELEQLRGNRLYWLTGDSSKPFFDTSWDSISARRQLAHERATSRRTMMQLAQAQGVAVDRELMARVQPGGKFKTAGQVEGEVLDMKSSIGNKVGGIRIGDTNYRQLDSQAVTGSIFEDMVGKDLKDYLLPEQTADVLESLMQSGKGDTGELLKMFDQFTGAWRSVTLTNPGWITNNFIGNTMLALSQRLITPGDIPAFANAAIKMHWNRDNPEILRQIVFNVGGQKINGEQLWNDLNRSRLVKNNLVDSTLTAMTGADVFPSARPWENTNRAALQNIRRDAGYVPSDWRFRMGTLADAHLGEQDALTKGTDAVRAGIDVGLDRYKRWFASPFSRLNSMGDDVTRTIAYLSLRNRGYDAQSATAKALDGLIDYTSLTDFEAKFMRRIVPFYAWIKNNTAIQFKNLLENPKWAALAPKLQNALEDSFNGEQTLPQNLRPRWMQDSLAVQIGTDPKTRQALLLMSGMPQEQLYRTLQGLVGVEGVQDMVKYFGNSTHPLFQSFYGVTTGVDPFSGKSIGPDGDMSLGQFAAKQIRPLSELGIGTGDKGGIGRAYEQRGVAGAGARVLLGGKLQSFDQERIDNWNYRELSKGEKALRLKIARAQNNGQDTLQLRADLIAVYGEMLRRGLDDKVPLWARRELAAVNQPVGG